MAQEAELKPGDFVMFKCGSQFNGPIHITESGTIEKPITLTAYGKGEAPQFTNPNDLNMNGNCIRISGSYLIIQKLHFHDTPPTKNADRLQSIFKMGAVFNMLGAKHNVIRENTFTKCTKGIQSTGEFTLITRTPWTARVTHCGRSLALKVGGDQWGFSLGSETKKSPYNTIKNYLTISSPYGSDRRCNRTG